MTGAHLLALYLAVGAAAAIVVARRGEGRPAARLASACVAWLLWPLWAPIALAPAEPPRPAHGVARLHAALDEVIAAAAGSPLAALLSADAARRIRTEIDRAASRIVELDATLDRPGFDPMAAEARVAELERAGASPRAIATARLHRDGAARLTRVRDRDRRALEELGDALEALRSQIVLARVAGPGGDDIVSDLWARVEGLGVFLDEDAANERGNERPDVVGSPEEART